MGVQQPSLFDTGDQPVWGPLGASVEHVDLGGGAWLDFRREWLGRADLVFDRLVDRVSWRAERRQMYDRIVDVPRLVSFFEEGEELPDPILVQARERLADHYADQPCGPVRTTGLCLYRSGADSVAWHGDTVGRHSERDSLVAIVSLGERRRFLLRPAVGGAGLRYDLGAGDLLVMGGRCQQTWQHAVPKSPRVSGPRISVQFRSSGLR